MVFAYSVIQRSVQEPYESNHYHIFHLEVNKDLLTALREKKGQQNLLLHDFDKVH